MKKINKILPVLALTLTASVVNAQNLNKEIVIDKEIVPELKESNRVKVLPQTPAMSMNNTQLKFNDKAQTAIVPAAISILEPADNVDTIKYSKYRGYASLGYFPVYNASASAGYRILDKNNIKLNAWIQYDGKTYDADRHNGSEVSMDDHEFTIKADYAQRLNSKSAINASIAYAYNNYFYPWRENGYTQNVNRFNFDAGWKSSIDGLKYKIEAGYSYFAFGKDAPCDTFNIAPFFEAVNEHGGYFKTQGAVEIDDNKSVSIDLGTSFLRYNQVTEPIWWYSDGNIINGYSRNEKYDHGLITAIPHYNIKIDDVSAKLGIRVDYQLDKHNKLRLAPDVHINWAADSLIAVYASATGGAHQNSLSSMFEISHYISPIMGYSNSMIPYALDFGVNLGPYKGASIEIFAGYASANDWYMPVYVREKWSLLNNIMQSVDMSGWHIGAAASYSYKKMFKVRASYEMAPQSYTHGYYLWRDRAKSVFKLSGSATPFDIPLELTLDYEYRGGRCAYEMTPEYVSEVGAMKYNHTRVSLGSKNSLSLGGLYNYTDQLSFFARLENIFNQKYDLQYDIPSQGITGLLGATYKF